MSEETLPIVIIPTALVGFVLFWSAVVFLTSRLSGWSALADSFEATYKPTGDTFRLRTAMLRRFVSYRSVLNIVVAPEGIHLSVLFPFRPGHRDLFIPWDYVRDISQSNYMLYRTTVLSIVPRHGGDPTRIRLFGGQLGDSILQHAPRTLRDDDGYNATYS